MRRLAALLACLALPTLALAAEPPGRRSLARACEELAAGKAPGERAAYLARCLKGEDPKAVRLVACREEADRRHGETRQEFLSECLKD